MNNATNPNTIWTCDAFDEALEHAEAATQRLIHDVGVWSFERSSGGRFYVAPLFGRIRFASHLCTVVEFDPSKAAA